MKLNFLVAFCVGTIGLSNAAPSNSSRFSLAAPHIVGGSNVVGRLPYQISLRVSQSNTGNLDASALKHFCGGTLIQSDIVLTAAHCLDRERLDALRRGRIYVVAGTNRLQFEPSSTFVSLVKDAIKHPGHGIGQGNANDVAVLQLETPATIDGKNIGLLPLRASPTNTETKCRISGWGHTKYGDSAAAEYLQSAVVPIVPTSTCQDNYSLIGFRITPDMVCAGLKVGGVDSCQGDSGGPLVCDRELTGVVSWGYRCAMASIPGVYASVFYHKNWIEEAINELQQNTTTDQPPATTQNPNNANIKRFSLVLILLSIANSFY